MEAGRNQLEAKPEETEIYHFFWSCLLYIFSVEEDGSNVRRDFFDTKHAVAQFLPFF